MDTMEKASPSRRGSLMMNPMIRKLDRVEEQSAERPATYGGIAAKTLFFMLAAAVGVAGYFILHALLPDEQAIQASGYHIYLIETLVAIVALVISVFSPLLAFAIRPLVPILGLIYCLSTAYTITWLGATMGGEYSGLIFLALGITIVLVAVMAFLYATGKVKVGHKFRTVVTALFITVACSSLIGFVLSLIPPLRGIVHYAQNDPIFSLIAGVIYIIVACAFLLVDFDTIQRAVERELPKKYEWAAAFGLAYTIIFLFLKIFSLLASAKQGGGNSAAAS